MCARKQQDVALNAAHTVDDAIGPRAYLGWGFAVRAAVAKQLPIRALLQDLGGSAAFVFAIVPFHQIGIALGVVAETRQLAGSRCALQRAGEDLGKGQAAQARTEGASVALAAFG